MGRSTKVSQPNVSNDHDLAEPQPEQQLHFRDRMVYLSGEMNEVSITQVIGGILTLANDNDKLPITLIVSTYGGSVDEMFSLYDVMKYVPCPIHTVGLGKIMSAGVLLLSAGTKGQRLLGANARVMIHSMSGGAHGNVFEIKNKSDEIQRHQQSMVDCLVAETKMSQQTLSKIMNTKIDTFYNARECVKLGIVDKIIGQ